MRLLPLLLLIPACETGPAPDVRSRNPHARALGLLQIGHRELREGDRAVIEKAFADPHPLVRDTVMIVASDLGLKDLAPQVAERLLDADEEVRVRACITLGEMGDESTMPALAKTLKEDNSARVRGEAARGLAAFGDRREVLEALVGGAADQDASVRYRCHVDLTRLTGKKDVPRDAEEWKKALGW